MDLDLGQSVGLGLCGGASASMHARRMKNLQGNVQPSQSTDSAPITCHRRGIGRACQPQNRLGTGPLPRAGARIHQSLFGKSRTRKTQSAQPQGLPANLEGRFAYGSEKLFRPATVEGIALATPDQHPSRPSWPGRLLGGARTAARRLHGELRPSAFPLRQAIVESGQWPFPLSGRRSSALCGVPTVRKARQAGARPG